MNRSVFGTIGGQVAFGTVTCVFSDGAFVGVVIALLTVTETVNCASFVVAVNVGENRASVEAVRVTLVCGETLHAYVQPLISEPVVEMTLNVHGGMLLLGPVHDLRS